METILLSLYIALYVPLMETAATRSTTVVLNLVEEGHVLEPRWSVTARRSSSFRLNYTSYSIGSTS